MIDFLLMNYERPKPHAFSHVQCSGFFGGEEDPQKPYEGKGKGRATESNLDDSPKPYEGKGKGRATEEDLRRMYPQDYPDQAEKARDEAQRTRDEAKKIYDQEMSLLDHEMAKGMQKEIDLQEMRLAENEAKNQMIKHNLRREELNEEENIVKRAELEEKCIKDKEIFENKKRFLEQLKEDYWNNYGSVPPSPQQSEYDSYSDVSSGEEQGRIFKKPKTSHASSSKNNENFILPVLPFRLFTFNTIVYIIRSLLFTITISFSFIFFVLPIFFSDLDILLYVPEFLLNWLPEWSNIMQGPLFIWSCFSLWRKLNKYVNLVNKIYYFINIIFYPYGLIVLVILLLIICRVILIL